MKTSVFRPSTLGRSRGMYLFGALGQLILVVVGFAIELGLSPTGDKLLREGEAKRAVLRLEGLLEKMRKNGELTPQDK
jgi:hypothetical protein